MSSASRVLSATRAVAARRTGRHRALEREARAAVGLAAIGAVRVALGAAALGAPQLTGRLWIGAEAGRPGAALLLRSLGGRDVGLGLGTLAASLAGRPVRPWALAGALADASDTAATLLAFGHLPARTRWLLVAGSGAVALTGLVLANRLEHR